MYSLTAICSPHLIECNDAICLIWRLPLNIDLLFKRSSLDGFQGNGSRNYRKKKKTNQKNVLEATTMSSCTQVRRHQKATRQEVQS